MEQSEIEQTAKKLVAKLPDNEAGQEMGEKLKDGASLLVAAARKIDAEAVPFRGVASLKNKIGERKFHFHEDLHRMEFEALLGTRFMIRDALIVPKWSGYFGLSRFALLWLKLENGDEVTTLAGAKVVYDQVAEIKQKRMLPIVATLNKRPSGQGGDYYILE